MRRETAYKLAGRRHGRRSAPADLVKTREIRFAPLPPGQIEQAEAALGRLRGLHVGRGAAPNVLVVRYSLLDYSLELLERALQDAGFHLSSSLYSKLLRAVVYFCESTQRRNMAMPERLIKQSNEVYIKVYDQHPHGFRDDTPLDLRDYR